MSDWREEGFEAWNALGFTSDYVSIDAKKMVIRPAWSPEGLVERGFCPSGTKMAFMNENGYDMEREHAASKFSADQILTVKECHIGQSSSNYVFEGHEGKWNTVMFARVVESDQ